MDPASLAGLAAQELQAAMGPPGLRRIDPPAELWQYMRARCVLDVVLYQPEAGGAPRVDHLEARDFGGRAMDLDDCLSASKPIS